MKPTISNDSDLAVAYTYLQKAVGVIAITLPFVIAIGDWVIGDHGLRGSISAYYYGRTGNYFVGSLFALAVFFLSYEYRPRPQRFADSYLSRFASAMAVGVALLPTPSNGADASVGSKWVGFFHLVCAGALFGSLAVFSLYQFTKTARDNEPGQSWAERINRVFRTPADALGAMSPSKQLRNRIYRACGWIIVASMAVIVLSNIFHWDVVFWFESSAVVAFGFSWLVKGGALFADPPAQ